MKMNGSLSSISTKGPPAELVRCKGEARIEVLEGQIGLGGLPKRYLHYLPGDLHYSIELEEHLGGLTLPPRPLPVFTSGSVV
jgi:hypothetical protein